MKTVWQKKKIYTGLTSAAGVASMEDLWRFARWVAEQLDQVVIVDGVEFATAHSLDSKDELTKSVAIKQPPGQYAFTRSYGAVLVSELADYGRWLDEQLVKTKKTTDGQIKLLTSQPGHLPLPQGRGLLLRRDLLTFIRAVAQRVGFGVAAPEIVSTHDDWRGLTVRRRRALYVARLAVEVEFKKVNAFACVYFIESGTTPDSFVVAETTVYHYANGDATYTAEATGDILTYQPGETPGTCDAIEYDNDYDPEFDYGTLNSTETSEELMPYQDLYDAASTALTTATTTSATQSYEWRPDVWAAISEVGGFDDEIMDPTTPVDVAVSGMLSGSSADEVSVSTTRWRATNNGDCDMIITWERMANDVAVQTGTITLAPDEVSDWIGPPTLPDAPDADAASYYRISRVQLNGL